MKRICNGSMYNTETARKIVIVDLGGSDEEKKAYQRTWSVIPDSEGNDADTYTYSGTLKAHGEIKQGLATTTDEWQTCSFEDGE